VPKPTISIVRAARLNKPSFAIDPTVAPADKGRVDNAPLSSLQISLIRGFVPLKVDVLNDNLAQCLDGKNVGVGLTIYT
jgi:hypothetical protein